MDIATLSRSSAYEVIARSSALGNFSPATATGGAAGLEGPQAVREFVAGTFFSILLAEMQKTIPEDSLCGSRAEGMFREMLNRQYASTLAASVRFPQVEAAIRQLGLKDDKEAIRAEGRNARVERPLRQV